MEFAMDREKKGSIDTDPVSVGRVQSCYYFLCACHCHHHARFTVIYTIWNEFLLWYLRKDTNSFVKCALILIRSERTVYDSISAYLENFPLYSCWTSEIFWRNVKKKFYRCLEYYIIKRIIMYRFKWIIIFILKISYLNISYVNFYFIIMNLNF